MPGRTAGQSEGAGARRRLAGDVPRRGAKAEGHVSSSIVTADDRDPIDRDCVFCRVLTGSEAAHEVWRDEVAVAFLDRSPLFRGHTLVIPTRHAITITDLAVDELGPFFERVQRVAAAMQLAFDAQGTFVANNNVVSQSVAHFHVHVVPRRKGDGLRGFFWPRQRYAAGDAEVCAVRLREALAAVPGAERRA
jgi:histidine triad (HIT) family protein